MNEESYQRLIAFIESKGLRMTAQREAILQAAFSTTNHYTADELLEMAKAKDSSVSRATVYRTLPLLVESGLLKELDLGRDSKFYDPNFAEHPNHNHIICDDCDKIFEFEDPELEKRENAVSKKLGFKLESQTVQLHGSCEKLKAMGVCSNLEEASPSQPVQTPQGIVS
ncbi:MAG: Fur family transcriptional regulator [Verrucomicrobiota bacterium]|nr:Fur family transcriptional regulator [Verrucomicrobiota bacterium]